MNEDFGDRRRLARVLTGLHVAIVSALVIVAGSLAGNPGGVLHDSWDAVILFAAFAALLAASWLGVRVAIERTSNAPFTSVSICLRRGVIAGATTGIAFYLALLALWVVLLATDRGSTGLGLGILLAGIGALFGTPIAAVTGSIVGVVLGGIDVLVLRGFSGYIAPATTPQHPAT